MSSGSDVEDVGRWLWNFVTAHAKREVLVAEAIVDPAPDGQRFRMRVRVGDRVAPPAGEPPLELCGAEVAAGRNALAWCAALAARVRELARAAAGPGARKSA